VWGYDETMIKQNAFHVVMSQRNPNVDTFDNFPTPPWAILRGYKDATFTHAFILS
jgi:hypothetical protein